MRIVRFNTQGQTKYGVLDGNIIHALADNPINQFQQGISYKYDKLDFKLDAVKLLAPCEPTKIVALGFNYRSHVAEANAKSGRTEPTQPLIFLKPNTAVIGPGENIILPKDAARRVDYEGELAVVIGKKAKEVAEDVAKSYIFGSTCLNDVSDRTASTEDNRWNTRSKGYDTFAPMGPWIETEVDPDNLMLETYVNGQLRQHAPTSDFIFNVSKLISFISGVMTLLPGDVIATGTPAGTTPMNEGDVIEVKIEKIGTLKNATVRHA